MYSSEMQWNVPSLVGDISRGGEEELLMRL